MSLDAICDTDEKWENGVSLECLEEYASMKEEIDTIEYNVSVEIKHEVFDPLGDHTYCKVPQEENRWDELYEGHEVKDELVLGPVVIQPSDSAYSVSQNATIGLDSTKANIDRQTNLYIDCSSQEEQIELNHEPVQEKYECEVCRKHFIQLKPFVEHMQTHTGDKLYECGTCKELFLDHTSFIDHLLTQPSDEHYKHRIFMKHRDCMNKNSHECVICKEKLCSEESLDKHLCMHTRENPYKCVICLQRFSDPSTHKKHLQKHKEEQNKYQCDICMKPFNRNYLKRHYQKIHNEKYENPYKCEICLKRFPNKKICIEHYRIHLAENPKDCEICLKQFYLKDSLVWHNQIHTEDKLNTFEIGLEDFPLKDTSFWHKQLNARKLQKRLHTEGKPHKQLYVEDKPQKCEICFEEFPSRFILYCHYGILTNENPTVKHRRTNTSDICKKRIAEAGGLAGLKGIRTVEISSSHDREEKPYDHDVGLKPYAKNYSSLVINEIHTREANQSPTNLETTKQILAVTVEACPENSDESIYAGTSNEQNQLQTCSDNIELSVNEDQLHRTQVICPENEANCETLTKEKGPAPAEASIDKQTNLFVNSGEQEEETINKNSHECVICKEKLCSEESLDKHLCMHTREKPYKCVICLQRFSDPSTHKKHLQKHKETQNIYQCDICMKPFNRNYLKRHYQKIHNEKYENPYKCEICLKRFPNKKTCIEHYRIHLAENPKDCEICLKQFYLKDSLVWHNQIHTEDKLNTFEIGLEDFPLKDTSFWHKQLNARKLQKRLHTEGKPHKQLYVEDKPQKCEICFEEFPSRFILYCHYGILTNENPTVKHRRTNTSDICKKRIAEAGGLAGLKGIRTVEISSSHDREEKPYDHDVGLKPYAKKYSSLVIKEIHTQEANQSPTNLETTKQILAVTVEACPENSDESIYAGTSNEQNQLQTCSDNIELSVNEDQLHRTQVTCSENEANCETLTKEKGPAPAEASIDKQTNLFVNSGEQGEESELNHEPFQKKSYTCDICSVQFLELSQLVEHVQRHTAEKLYECTTCKRTFDDHIRFVEHVQNHPTYEQCKNESTQEHQDKNISSYEKNGEKNSSSGASIDGQENELNHKSIQEKPYKCEICFVEFTSRFMLYCHYGIFTIENPTSKHRIINTEGTPFDSDMCKKQFAEAGGLTRLKLSLFRTKEIIYKRDICMKSSAKNHTLFVQKQNHTQYQLVENMQNHMETTGENKYNCGTKKLTDSSWIVNNEINEHIPHKTDPSNDLYNSENSYKDFIANKYQIHTEENSHECVICMKNINSEADLLQYLKNHAKEKLYECEICFIKLSDQSAMVDHEKTHTGNKPPDSDVTKKQFGKSDSLTLDRQININEPFKCDICLKQFPDEKTSAEHHRTHSNENLYELDSVLHKQFQSVKKHECNICLKAFQFTSDLFRHKRIHTGEKPYECNICSKRFSDHSNLVTHTRIHTGEKPFQCEICKKSFSLGGNFSSHCKKMHKVEKPYKCEICSEKFPNKRTCVKHYRIHLSKNPQECDICQIQFSLKDCLSWHKRLHCK